MVKGCTLLLLAANTWLDIRKKEVSLILIGVYGAAGIVRIIYLGTDFRQFLPGVCLGVFFLAVSAVTSGALGMGDGWLLAVLGTMLDPAELLVTLCIGVFASALWALVLLVVCRKSRKAEFPFVPFLLLGYLGGLCL